MPPVPSEGSPHPSPTAPSTGLRRELGLWDLVLLNVVAITGLRWWLTSAGGYGYAALPLWGLAFLCFFLPSGLAVIDLTTRHPEEGGIYVWTKRAFGDGHGFIAGWCLWTNNLVYFPHLLIFTVSNFIFMFGAQYMHLENNQWIMGLSSLVLFWIAVSMNVRGLRYGRWLNNLGALGTWIPAALLILVGGWALWRYGSATPFEAGGLIPVFDLGTVSFFSLICFGFSGLELGSVMCGEIIEPRKNVPRAILISGVIITLIYVLGTAALLVALPQKDIGILSGVGSAIAAVQAKMGLGFLAGISALLIALGGMGGVSAWLAGSSRIPYVAGIDRYLPASFGRVHPRYATPHIALYVTGAISTLMILMSFAGASVKEAYELLALFTTIVYFIPYLYLFASVMKLGVAESLTEGVIPVPGGRFGAMLVGTVGFLTTAVAIVFALVPPADALNPWFFEAKILGGFVLLLLTGWMLYRRGRRVA
ncbi:MAG TPA: APC family permease [Candidatus Polarisedimenticolia bacterium]|nr:APC family permease [Candidatus Polarisedimenticolia bacterium]